MNQKVYYFRHSKIKPDLLCNLVLCTGYKTTCKKQLIDIWSNYSPYKAWLGVLSPRSVIDLQNMPVHSIQTIWASNALLHINMDILSPWVAKM